MKVMLLINCLGCVAAGLLRPCGHPAAARVAQPPPPPLASYLAVTAACPAPLFLGFGPLAPR